jgi:Glycogen recognition site of AMP-activated protein kinase
MTLRCEQTVLEQHTRCTFRLEGVRAASVALVGSFNEWSTTRHLMRFIDGRWETEVTLPPGRHAYGFFAIEDGKFPRGSILQMRSTIEIGLPSSSYQLPAGEHFVPMTA